MNGLMLGAYSYYNYNLFAFKPFSSTVACIKPLLSPILDVIRLIERKLLSVHLKAPKLHGNQIP